MDRPVTSTVLLAVAALGSVTTATAAQSSGSEASVADLWDLYRARELFTLRERLDGSTSASNDPPEIRFLEATVLHASNRPQAARNLAALLLQRDDLSPVLAVRLRHLLMSADLRLHRYPQALESARAILDAPTAPETVALVSDTRDKATLLSVLADVPPQEVEIRAPSRLALGPTRRIPVKINGSSRSFALDTGANFSVIMRSEAIQLGLPIRRAGVSVATSTAKKVLADVAVADRVEIGNIDYRNVVFLVFPDQLLTFPDGLRIPGLVGFPVVEAMQEVRFRRDNVVEVPSKPPVRREGNLALDDLEPLIQIRYGRDELICRLDTGAAVTVFYQPFFQRYRQRVEAIGVPVTTTARGIGGAEEIPAYRIPRLVFTVAGAGVTLRRVEIYRRSIRPTEENYLFCNLGLDVLHQFRSYTINFNQLALVLQ